MTSLLLPNRLGIPQLMAVVIIAGAAILGNDLGDQAIAWINQFEVFSL